MLDIDEPFEDIQASIIYNPFDLSDRTDAVLEYVSGRSLAAYVDGLPEEIEWQFALNGKPLDDRGLALIFPQPGDHLVAMPVPEGGGGGDGKAVLALVATLALSVFAPYAGAAISNSLLGGSALATKLATAAVSIAGGLLINALIPAPETTADSSEMSYGIDGPKNTSTEGIPYPVLYGEHAFGGNVADLYTQNTTDEDGKPIQYLYGRVIVSEGPIDDITEFFLNDQPLANFQDVEVDYRRGHSKQTACEWFNDTITMQNKGVELNTTWQTHTTTTEVDKIRLDFVAPTGLGYTDNKGRDGEISVEIEAEYSPTAQNDWKPILSEKVWSELADPNATSTHFKVEASVRNNAFVDPGFSTTHYNVTLQYRVKGSVDPWTSLATRTGDLGPSEFETVTWIETGLAANAWEFQLVVTGTNITGEIQNTFIKTPASIVITDDSTQAVRRTYQSEVLEEGVYDIRYRRVNAPTGNDGWRETVLLSDIGEIITENLNLPYVAWAGFKIKLTGQLNAVPQFTGVARGRLVPIYDHNGNVTDIALSSNPADIALDIYLNTRYGAAVEPERIDFAAYAEWRDFCTDNNLTFDGIFYESSNVDDALKSVYIAGRAQRVTSGAKVSVAIDREDSPTMLFGHGNIRRDSFAIDYLPFEDRINDLEIAFNDKNDNYKRRVARVTNDAALNRGEPLKTAGIELKGITDYDRALREGVLRMNYNRLVNRTAEWESPIEAVGCTVGDVVVVQHEMMGWGTGGRIMPSSTSIQLKLDRDITFKPGKSYRVLVHQNAKTWHSNLTVSGQTGNLVTLSTPIDVTAKLDRFISNTLGVDLAITRIIDATTLLLESSAADTDLTTVTDFATVETDHVDDVTVTNPATTVDVVTDTIDLDTSLVSAPADYANYIFGEVAFTKKPFRIKSISRPADGFVTLTAVEYVPEVYSDSPTVGTHNYSSLTASDHVTNLTIEERLVERDTSFVSRVRLNWEQPETGVYAGAEIQVSVNGDPFKAIDRTTDTRYGFRAEKGDVVLARVVAIRFDKGEPIDPLGAPVVGLTVQGVNANPTTPTGLTAIGIYSAISLSWNSISDPDLRYYEIRSKANGTTPAETDDADFFANLNSFSDVSVSEGETRYYWVRSRDVSGNKSPWSEVATATALTLEETRSDPTSPGVLYLSTSLVANGVAKVVATWGAVSDASAYELGVKLEGGNEVYINTSGTAYEFETSPGLEYTIRLRSINTVGRKSAWTAGQAIVSAVDEVPPAKPTDLTATGNFGANWVEWSEVPDTDLSHYELCIKDNSSTPPSTPTAPVVKLLSTIYVDGGLDSGVTKYYFVRAVDTSGNKSPWSTVASATTLPSNLGVTAEDIEGLVDATSFATGLTPVGVVDTLPADNSEYDVVVLTTDSKLYRWTGSAFTKAVDGYDLVTDSVTTGAISSGAVNTEQLAAGAATVTKLGVGDLTNLLAGGDFEEINNVPWDISSVGMYITSAESYTGSNCLLIPAASGTADMFKSIEVQPGDELYLSCRAKRALAYDGSDGSNSKLRFSDGAGAYITDLQLPSTLLTTSWVKYEKYITIPAGVNRLKVQLHFHDGTTGHVLLDNVEMRRRNTGELLVDGIIKSNHIYTPDLYATIATFDTAYITDANIVGMDAAKIFVPSGSDGLSANITVAGSGTTIGDIEGWASDPGARINNGPVTNISPGKITIAGSTTLDDWRATGKTTINGGKIETDSIKADSVDATEILVGEAEIAGSIWSSNYVANTSGWAIFKGGWAEFGGIHVREDEGLKTGNLSDGAVSAAASNSKGADENISNDTAVWTQVLTSGNTAWNGSKPLFITGLIWVTVSTSAAYVEYRIRVNGSTVYNSKTVVVSGVNSLPIAVAYEASSYGGTNAVTIEVKKSVATGNTVTVKQGSTLAAFELKK